MVLNYLKHKLLRKWSPFFFFFFPNLLSFSWSFPFSKSLLRCSRLGRFICIQSILFIAFIAFVTLYFNVLPILFSSQLLCKSLKSVTFNKKDEFASRNYSCIICHWAIQIHEMSTSSSWKNPCASHCCSVQGCQLMCICYSHSVLIFSSTPQQEKWWPANTFWDIIINEKLNIKKISTYS